MMYFQILNLLSAGLRGDIAAAPVQMPHSCVNFNEAHIGSTGYFAVMASSHYILILLSCLSCLVRIIMLFLNGYRAFT